MKALMRKLFGATALLAAIALPPVANATLTPVTIDFNDPGLTNLYFPGDSFTQSGFRMTVDYDFGTVDTAAALGPLAPSGNATPFYFQSNDGGLIVERAVNNVFSLTGFSAAFVPLSPASSLTTVIVAVALDSNHNFLSGVAWTFAPAVNNVYPFATYSNPADFASFADVAGVEFFACSLVNQQVCSVATQNDGQFAIDNIQVSVPEPGSIALVMLAMLGLGVTMRRRVG
jgi:hypothetical protein